MAKYVLVEDDCAPDAREYFMKNMKEKFNLDFMDFKKHGVKVEPDELSMEWHYNGYVLSFHGDDPFYKLRKEGH